MGSVIVEIDLLFLLGEVGSGESSLQEETRGERALEDRVEGVSGVERGSWAVVVERVRAEGGTEQEGTGTRGPGERGEEGESAVE